MSCQPEWRVKYCSPERHTYMSMIDRLWCYDWPVKDNHIVCRQEYSDIRITYVYLTHRGRDKMAILFLMTFANAFYWEKYMNSIKISLKFVANGPINNIPELVQIMAWHRPWDEPWLFDWKIYASVGHNELKSRSKKLNITYIYHIYIYTYVYIHNSMFVWVSVNITRSTRERNE